MEDGLSGDASASLDKEMTYYFENMQIDDDWDQLHSKIVNTRVARQMTITEFLMCVGLNPNRSYFRQLSTKSIRKLHPSMKENSPGREFRDAVSKYLENLTADSIDTLYHGSPQLFETVISDWCLDNRSELRGLGISGIYLSKSNPVGIIIHAYQYRF